MKATRRAARPNAPACPDAVAPPPAPPQSLPKFFAESRNGSTHPAINLAAVRHLVFELEDPLHQAVDYGRIAELLTESGRPLTSADIGVLYRAITDSLAGARRAKALWRELHKTLNAKAEEVMP